jgi:Cu-processing system permease protein
MGRVARALVVHELLERARDKWVLLSSMLFAALTLAVSLYGRSAGESAMGLIGPSLVTLASLFVPLVALVLSHDAVVGERERNTLGLLLSLPVSRMEVVVAKFLGRGLALTIAVTLGVGIPALVASDGLGGILFSLIGPTLLLGLAFLALGLLISAVVSRQVTAASLVVVIWFTLVFFYDLALLGVLVVSDGAVSQEMIASLVFGNPAGLYRVQMMSYLAGPEVLQNLGMAVSLPQPLSAALIWIAWIFGPVLVSGVLLSRRKVV